MLLDPWLMLHDKYFGNFLDSEDWEWEKNCCFYETFSISDIAVFCNSKQYC